MLVLKKLLKAQQDIQRNIANKKDINLNIEKYKALDEIIRYVLSFKYVKDFELRERVLEFLNYTEYDDYCTLSKMPVRDSVKVKKIAEKHGVTTRAMQILIRSTDKVAENLVGENTIDLIMQGNVKIAMQNFRISTTDVDVSKLFVKGIQKLLPAPEESENLKLSDCKAELLTLSFYTNESTYKQFNSLDKKKMSFLMYLLTNDDSRYVNEKKLIIDYLNGSTEITNILEL